MRRRAVGSFAMLVTTAVAALLVAAPAGAEKTSRPAGWSSGPPPSGPTTRPTAGPPPGSNPGRPPGMSAGPPSGPPPGPPPGSPPGRPPGWSGGPPPGPSYGRPPGPPPGGSPPHDHGHGHGHGYYPRYYPPRGYVLPAPPPGYYTSYYGYDRYYYGGGAWYRPYGPYVRVILPPVGIVVPFLPSVYTTMWFGGVPYYYANSVYYLGRDDGTYVVANPPNGASTSVPAESEELFVYPKEGQSEEQQARDRYECHRWAFEQTGFDPSVPGGGVPESENATARSEYRRAITACLDAMGYTVR